MICDHIWQISNKMYKTTVVAFFKTFPTMYVTCTSKEKIILVILGLISKKPKGQKRGLLVKNVWSEINLKS